MEFKDKDIGLGRHYGQKVCGNCSKSFNNRAVPEFCDQCNHYLGGKFEIKDKKLKDSLLITATLASVRTNPAGVATRTFVDVALNMVNFIL